VLAGEFIHGGENLGRRSSDGFQVRMGKDEREQLLFAAVVGLMKRTIRSEPMF
jgi:hypothetical protein